MEAALRQRLPLVLNQAALLVVVRRVDLHRVGPKALPEVAPRVDPLEGNQRGELADPEQSQPATPLDYPTAGPTRPQP